MKKLILVIELLFAVLISFAQREVDADVVIVRDSINLDGEWIKFISPINGQVISRVDGVWKNTANTLSQPVDSIQFNSDVAPIPNTDYTLYADTANNSLSFKTGLGSTAQIARESLIKVYNNNGVTIPNGDVISTSGVMPDGTITVVRAIATNRYDALLWATTDIPVGEVGDAIVVYGSIRDVPTSGLISVGQVWLSDVDTGKVVKIKPTFPAYEYSLGAVTKIDAVTGQYEARLDGIDPYSTIRNTYNGQFRETIAATVASDGATITLSLERSGGGDLTQMWSSGLRDLDCTPACTVVLTAGTDIAPQPNYVYILKSNPDVLVVSTSGFPKGVEYEHVFDGALFSASRTQTDDALANRNWNDHIQDTIGQGHLLHISERIRQDNAQWNSGMTATMTVGGGTTIDISQTAGDAYQLHLQNVDAMNTATGSYMYVQNDFTTAWDKITDIESITTDANGNALLNTSYSLVTYSVANKSGETDQYVLTVPTGTYSKNVPQNAEDDLSNYAVYDFPSYLKGKAVLVAKFNIVNNNGTISLFSTQDLRGKVPNAAIGGGGGSTGAADFLSLLDTYSSYSGLAYTGLKVDLGEAGLIATQWTEDASGNFNAVGTISENSVPVASSTEIIDSIFTTENVSFSSDSINYTKNGVTYNVTEVRNPDGIDQGGIVTLETGLIYNISPCKYQINGVPFESITGQETLTTADVTNPRIDIIVVDTFGVTDIVTGVAAASPQKPTANPESQIELTSILVNAGATTGEPGGGGSESITVVYDENVEWVGGAVGTTVDFASATDPFHGTINAEVTNISNVDYITFTAPVAISSTDITNFSMYLKLKEAATKRHRLYVQLLNDGGGVTTILQLPMDYTNTGWQNLSISLEGVRFSQDSIDEVQLVWAKTPDVVFSGFYIDLVQLQGGYDQPATIQPHSHPISDVTGLQDSLDLKWNNDGSSIATGDFDLGLFDLYADSLSITNGATVGGNTEVDGYVLATINSVGSITFPLMVANTSLTIGTEAGIKLGASSAPDIRYAAITGYQEGSNTTNVKIYTGAGGTLTERIDVDGNTGTTTFSDDVVSPTYGTTEQTLTETAGAVAWDVSDGSEVGVTIDETSVITLTNIPVGWKGNIDITQGDAGDDNATFVASGYTVKWRNDEQDLTDASGAVDVVSLRVRGAIIYVTWGGPYVTQ